MATATANVYEKLQAARVELQAANIKKSGKNTHMKYEYFELSDFLPEINRIFREKKLFSAVTFTSELATLTIINTEKPDETIEFTSPMASASLKAAHDIQNLGAVETYQRRYLYMTALEIVEQDTLDKGQGSQSSWRQSKSGTKTDAPANNRPAATASPPNSSTNGYTTARPDDTNDVQKALTAYHEALTPLMPDEADRKDLIRYAYCKLLESKGEEITVPSSTTHIPADVIRKYTAKMRYMDGESLTGLLDDWRTQFAPNLAGAPF